MNHFHTPPLTATASFCKRGLLSLAAAVLVGLPATVAAQEGPAPVLLGAAENYVVLAKTGISTVPAAVITGNIGVSPVAATAITGFSLIHATGYATSSQLTGRAYAADMAGPTPTNLTTAIGDMETAFTDAAGRPGPDFTELYVGNIGGRVLAPGLYKWSGTVTAPTSFEISGGPDDVWIFQIAGDLTVGSDVILTLSGGAQPQNIFWQVSGAVNVGTDSHVEGVILSMTGITLQQGASLNGRALAQTAVVLDQNTVSMPLNTRLQASEGWRMLAAPAADLTIGDVVGSLWTQGYPGADHEGGLPNVYSYTESTPGELIDGYIPAPSQAAAWAPGTGRFVYVYEDDDYRTPGIQGGFPKLFSVGGAPLVPPFTFDLSYTDDPDASADLDGWNLLGNPFGTSLDWDAVEIGGALDASVYAYDPAYLGGSYRAYAGGIGALTDGVVASMQGFWVHTTAPGATLAAPAASQTSGGTLYRGATASAGALRFELREGGTAGAEAFVSASSVGTLGLDAYDAYALDPPRAGFLRLATEAVTGQTRLAIQSLPDGLSGETRLPLAAEVIGGPSGARSLVLAWDAAALPAGWAAHLVDTATGESRGLSAGGTYAFETTAGAERTIESPLATVSRGGPARFQVVLTQTAVAGETGVTGALALSVTPNPISGRGTVRVSVPTAGHVRVVITDVLGREVAVLVDGERPAGPSDVALETGRLAPGVYVVRLVAGSEATVRRVTVAR
ncbi:MAG TPA: ice-binding family protein [Rubricoccaceae bacterium]|jgi:hypothetical protein